MQASQTAGELRPAFAAEDGGPIFPVEGDEMEHTWFLTEMSKRKLAAEQSAADAIEEGQTEDEEESDGDGAPHDKDNKLLSDDDPMTSPLFYSPRSPPIAPPETCSAPSDSQADGGLPILRGPSRRWQSQQADSLDTGSSSLQ